MGTPNPDIGRIRCPFTGEVSPLRRYKTGQRLAYFHSKAGKIAPNLDAGQKFIYENAEFYDPEDKRQIGEWLTRRGIQLEPGNPEPQPEPPAGNNLDMVETVIGGDRPAEPGPIGSDPKPVQAPPTPARSGGAGFWQNFLAGDDE